MDMQNKNETIDYYYGNYKRGLLGKKYPIKLVVMSTCIEVIGFAICDDELDKNVSEHTIPLKSINRIYMGEYNGECNITIEYTAQETVRSTYAVIMIFGIEDMGKWIDLVNTAKRDYMAEENRKMQAKYFEKRAIEQKQKEKEENALNFYQKCYDFHIKENTPRFNLLESKNKVALVYLDDSKALHFLKIDGYGEEENCGIITYENIHYYERSGNVHFVTDIHGNYTSYGGSMTGGSFSQLAAVGGGLLFGLVGMGIGAALTYEPAKQESQKTNFTIDSTVKRIDERNVILNFYSDIKKQYVDIELPQEIFNFLQTYLPEKKMTIVEEMEKKKIVFQSESATNYETIATGQKEEIIRAYLRNIIFCIISRLDSPITKS